MITGAERGRNFASLATACLIFAAGCRKTPVPAGSSELGAACASACSVLVSSGCFGDGAPTGQQRECVASCRATEATVRAAECMSSQLSLLGCIGHRENVSCGAVRSPRGFFGPALPISACQREQLAFASCSRPCREPGVIHEASRAVRHRGEERQVSAELVELGCDGSGGAPGQRSPAGAPCTHHSVCSPVRCPCGGPGAYLARACVDGRCSPAELACSIVLETVEHDACGQGLTDGELTPPRVRR